MKILFLPTYTSPERAASLYIADNRYEAFARAGFDMLAYAPYPSRGLEEEEIREYRKVNSETLYNGRMTIKRFSLRAEKTRLAGRLFRYLIQNLKQYCWGRKKENVEGVDVLFAASTPPLHGYMASLLGKRHHIPFVYNVQDIFPDSLFTTGVVKNRGLLWRWGNSIENKTYRNADKIIVISEDFKRNIMAKGVPEEKIVVNL